MFNLQQSTIVAETNGTETTLIAQPTQSWGNFLGGNSGLLNNNITCHLGANALCQDRTGSELPPPDTARGFTARNHFQTMFHLTLEFLGSLFLQLEYLLWPTRQTARPFGMADPPTLI